MITAAFILTAYAATVAVNWPGHLSFDSLAQLHDGRTGRYNTWHPPAMAWLLGLFDAVVRGTGLYLALSAALFFGALASLVWLRPQTGWPALAAAMAMAVLPQAVLYQGLVWKDVLFANAAVATFVALTHAAAHWNRPRRRALLLAVTFVLAVLAALVRQNGLVVPLVAAAVLAGVARRRGASGWRSGAAFAVASLVVVFVASALLDLRSIGMSGSVMQLRALEAYDLTAMIAHDRALPLSVLEREAPLLAKAIRAQGPVLYLPSRIDPEMSDPAFQRALVSARPDAVSAQWLALVAGRPLLYLRTRLDAFAWVTLTPDIMVCRPIFTGVDGPPDLLRADGFAPRQDARDNALRDYALRFAHTPVFSHATYGVLGLICLWFLLRRRRPEDIAIAGMIAAALLFSGSFFVLSIACDYRYLYVLDLSGLAAAFYLALSWPWRAAPGSPDGARLPSSRSSASR